MHTWPVTQNARACYLQAFDLVIGQVGLIIDLLKVNVGVGIGLGHDEGVISLLKKKVVLMRK